MKLWVAQFLGVKEWFVLRMDDVVVIDLLQDCQVFSPLFISDTFGRWWQGRAALVGGRSTCFGRVPSRSLCQRVNLQFQFIKFLVILPFNFQLSLHLERGTHHAY